METKYQNNSGKEDMYLSLKRIEYLLQELLYQQILSRTQNKEQADTLIDESLKIVHHNVTKHLEESFPPIKNDGNYHVS